MTTLEKLHESVFSKDSDRNMDNRAENYRENNKPEKDFNLFTEKCK